MDSNRFDELTRTLSTGRSRREVIKTLGAAVFGAAGLSRLGHAEAAQGGNSACDQWCHENFSGAAAGQCTSQAAQGGGTCYECGPAAPAGHGKQLCNGACLDVSGDPNNCGTCGNACQAVDMCTPANCIDGTCNQTSACTGDEQCGFGGAPHLCGVPDCPEPSVDSTYDSTCFRREFDCTPEGNILSARCEDAVGHLVNASINVNDCESENYVISNCNGQLTCGDC